MRPRSISLLVSLIVSTCILIVSQIVLNDWKQSGIIAAASLLFSFIFYLIGMERYIARRISLVYKLISNLKIDRELKKALGHQVGDDPINQIEKEVSQWANEKSFEIETLKKNAQYRKEFLGNLSHELKTPLFNIQGYVQSLIDGGIEDKATAENFLRKAERNIDRLCSLVDDVDVMSKLDSGEMPLVISTFDIAALIRDIWDTLDEKATKKNITMDMSTNEKKLVSADKEKIAQVVSNLLDNSIKYGKQDGVTTVKFYTMGEQLLIEITDDGEGIEEHHLPRLFERFYRVDRSRRSQAGSGIGLAIVKHIIDAHQQTINVRSTVAVGTTFAFTLQSK